MMNNWRPPDWEDIKPRVPDCEGVGQWAFDRGVEAGANAMFTAISKYMNISIELLWQLLKELRELDERTHD